ASTLDLRRLISALLRRAAALPGRLVAELKRFRKFLSRGEDPVANFTTWGWRFFSVLMLVLVLAQTAMPTAVYAKGFGGHVSAPAGGAHFGGGMHYGGGGDHPGWSSPYPGHGHPMMRPAAPVVRQRSGYVSGGAGGYVTTPYYYSGGYVTTPYNYAGGTVTAPYYYWYSDANYNYYYCYYNGRYYY